METPVYSSESPLTARAWAVTALIFLAFLTIGSVIQRVYMPLGVWITELFVFGAIPWVAIQRLGFMPLWFCRLAPFRFSELMLGFVLGAANFFAFIVPLQFLSQRIFPHWLVELFDGSKIFSDQTRTDMVILVGAVSLAAPLCEEFYFRGFLQQSLASRIKPHHAILISAFIFSAFHLDPVGFLSRFQLGILFGLLFFRSSSLAVSIGAHAANNLVSLALFFLSRGAEKEEAEPAIWQVLLISSVGVACMLGILALVRRGNLLRFSSTGPDFRPTDVKPFKFLIRPWIIAAMLSLSVLAVLSPRSLGLYWIELKHPVAPANRTKAETLRTRAKRREITLEEYDNSLKLLRNRPPSPPPQTD